MKREKTKMTQKQNTLTKTGIVALLACICCILWGSAIPVIKTGYRLMQVDSADTASQIGSSFYTGGNPGTDLCINQRKESDDPR
jgi:hypothetical protein